MGRFNSSQMVHASLILLLALAANSGCVARSGGGGGGGGGGGDDDDAGGGGEDMRLTLVISNQTGYDWNGYGWRGGDDPVETAPAVESIDGLFTDGTTSSVTDTFTNVEYGVQFCLAFRARDTDEDCYDWNFGGECYNTGAELSIEIIVDFDHYEGGGCPAW